MSVRVLWAPLLQMSDPSSSSAPEAGSNRGSLPLNEDDESAVSNTVRHSIHRLLSAPEEAQLKGSSMLSTPRRDILDDAGCSTDALPPHPPPSMSEDLHTAVVHTSEPSTFSPQTDADPRSSSDSHSEQLDPRGAVPVDDEGPVQQQLQAAASEAEPEPIGQEDVDERPLLFLVPVEQLASWHWRPYWPWVATSAAAVVLLFMSLLAEPCRETGYTCLDGRIECVSSQEANKYDPRELNCADGGCSCCFMSTEAEKSPSSPAHDWAHDWPPYRSRGRSRG